MSHYLIRPHHNLLISEHILKSKVETNSVYIPTDTFLNLHNALGWQINDLGYYFNAISLKSCYDALILNLNHSATALSFLLRNKYGRAYLKLLKHYFNDYDSCGDCRRTDFVSGCIN